MSSAGMELYLRNLAGTQNLPRMLLVSEQHHVTVRSSGAQAIHRFHQNLGEITGDDTGDIISPGALWEVYSQRGSLC